jgi:hypothetical protein
VFFDTQQIAGMGFCVTQNESVNMPLSRLWDSDVSRALLVLSGAV